MIALTRPVSPSLGRCELTHLERVPIDVELAAQQHAAYERALATLGARCVRLPEEPDLPDAVFVEDTALVLDEIAVITNPGAPSRRPELETVIHALADHRPLHRIRPPGTLDGGDVMRVGRSLVVGLSSRTNADGVAQLRDATAPFDYTVVPIPVVGCLHLKSACSHLGRGAILLNPAWVDPQHFAAYERIAVDEREPAAANALALGGGLIVSRSFARTRDRLNARGFNTVDVEVSELHKAEAGVTCMSILVA